MHGDDSNSHVHIELSAKMKSKKAEHISSFFFVFFSYSVFCRVSLSLFCLETRAAAVVAAG